MDVRVDVLDLCIQRVYVALGLRQLGHVGVVAVEVTAHFQLIQQGCHLGIVLRGQLLGQGVRLLLVCFGELIAPRKGHLALLRRQYLGGHAAGAEVVQDAHTLCLPPHGHQRQQGLVGGYAVALAGNGGGVAGIGLVGVGEAAVLLLVVKQRVQQVDAVLDEPRVVLRVNADGAQRHDDLRHRLRVPCTPAAEIAGVQLQFGQAVQHLVHGVFHVEG